MEFIGEKLPETGIRIYRLAGLLRHSAPGIEVLFVLSGKVQAETGKEAYRLAEPDVLLLSRQELIRIAPDTRQEECLLLVLRVAPDFLSFAFGGTIPAFTCNSMSPGSPDCAMLRSLLAETACHDMGGNGGNGLLRHSVLFRLLHELKRNFSEAEDTKGESDEKRRERMITAYIKKNYREPLTLDELAKRLALTPQYLSRYFRKNFGVNFHAYVNKIRLESAIKDLLLSNATVTAIAYDNGFPNLSSFIKELRDHTGTNPTEYRRTHKINERENDEDVVAVGNGESGLALEKLRPYLRLENTVSFQKKTLIVDADAGNGTPYQRPWKEVINLGFARDFTKAPFNNQINLLQNEAPFRYGRFQGLFGKSALITAGPNREYNFVQIDRIINFLYEVNLIPFVELAFKPDSVTGKHGEPVFNNREEVQNMPLDEYEKLIERFLKHIINRYGLREINRWRFEMMAPYGEWVVYTESDLDAYIEQFVKIRKIIKDIAPSAMVGGPGFNLARPENLDIVGKILYGLGKKECLPDFFSFYAFSISPLPATGKKTEGPLFWEKYENVKRVAWAKEFIQSFDPSIKKFFVTEWNLDFSSRNRLHDSLMKASFILQNNIDAIGAIDVLCYWLASDISVEYSDSSAILFGGPGLLSRNGIRKPSFFAYHFLSMLGLVLLAKGEGYIVTSKSKNNYAAIIFNYKYISNQSRLRNDYHELEKDTREFLEDTESLTVDLRISGTQPGRYKITQHILNTHNGSIYDAWKRLSSVDELSDGEASWLEHACVPSLKIDFISDTGGRILLGFELEANEVRFLEISRILE
jgi:beta-xylosidase/AraC-like DNA-binding protein